MYKKFVFILALFSLTQNAYARVDIDIHCGNRWVGTGATQAEVVKYCGEPDSTYDWQEVISQSRYYPPEQRQYVEGAYKEEVTKVINYSRWMYDQGSTQFTKYLLFKNGILVDVDSGDYGSN